MGCNSVFTMTGVLHWTLAAEGLICEIFGLSGVAAAVFVHSAESTSTGVSKFICTEFTSGLAWIIPGVTALAFGPDRIFDIVARTFNRDPDRLQKDGAFMASLLDQQSVHVGDAW